MANSFTASPGEMPYDDTDEPDYEDEPEAEAERCPECGCFVETDLHDWDCSYRDD